MKEKIKFALLIAESFLLSGLTAFNVFASSSGDGAVSSDTSDISWLKSEGNGTFDDATDSIKGILASGYGFVFIASSGLMVLFLILGALSYAGGSTRTKDEAKSKILSVFIGCFIMAASVSLVSLIFGIANGAF